jgi:hypothetical protein
MSKCNRLPLLQGVSPEKYGDGKRSGKIFAFADFIRSFLPLNAAYFLAMRRQRMRVERKMT